MYYYALQKERKREAKMMMYEERSAVIASTSTNTEPISIESDRESTKSDSDSECTPPKMKQDMFIWNTHFEASPSVLLVVCTLKFPRSDRSGCFLHE